MCVCAEGTTSRLARGPLLAMGLLSFCPPLAQGLLQLVECAHFQPWPLLPRRRPLEKDLPVACLFGEAWQGEGKETWLKAPETVWRVQLQPTGFPAGS